MEWNNGNYDRWRRRKAWRNIIVIIIVMILIVWLFGYLSELNVNSKEKTKESFIKLSIAIKEKKLLTKREELDLLKKGGRVIPLNENIIMKCISGKKAIIVNDEIYYAGDLDTWGDIKGVDCE